MSLQYFPEYKIFNHKRYTLDIWFYSKVKADTRAKTLRYQGMLARVMKYPFVGKHAAYAVYIRNK